MSYTKKLWNLFVTTSPDLAEAFAEPLSETGALVVSVFSKPREPIARIEAIFDAAPEKSEITARIAIIAALHKTKTPKIEIHEVPQINWLAKVADDFPPFTVGRWTIYSPEHRARLLRPHRSLQIEATSAFGTGEHPTTKGCLLLLDRFLKSPLPRSGRGRGPSRSDGRVRALDLGCGSGILAMAWSQATKRSAIATDLDPQSVQITKTNLRNNGLQSCVTPGLARGYTSPLIRHKAPYDLIMSNIFAGPLCQMAHQLKQHLRPGGTVILSGILTRQANQVISAHRLQGIYLLKRLDIGEWSALALQRRKRAK